jgi:hypothetical protein
LRADPIKLPLNGNAIADPSHVNDLASYALLREKLAAQLRKGFLPIATWEHRRKGSMQLRPVS